MYYTKKSNFKLFVLLFILQFSYSFQEENAKNGTFLPKRRNRVLPKDFPSVQSAVVLGVLLSACKPPEDEVKTCTINIKTLDPSHSLLIEPGDHTKFVYPDDEGLIHMIQRQPIFLSCPGENNKLKLSNVQSVTAYCVCNTLFELETGELSDFSTFNCERPPENTIVLKQLYGREGVFRKYDVGFYTDTYHNFLNVMSINYDAEAISAIYVRSVISKSIAGSQKTAKNRRFDQTYCCDAFPLNLDVAYKPEIQDESFGKQMKCHAEKKCSYLDVSKDIIFNRGHLAPKSTFVYTAAGIATFRYVNTAPQWKPVNDGNWARIEEHVVTLATKFHKDIVTITGVLNSLRLPDTSDYDTEKFIYLYEKEGAKAVEVPLYFYKLAYEPESMKGIVYVTVNNPFIKDDFFNYHICRSPMTQIPGGKVPAKWKPKLVSKGYSYFCEVPDFLEYNYMIFDDPEVVKVKGLLYEPGTVIGNINNNKIEIDTDAQSTEETDKPSTSQLSPRDELKKRSIEQSARE